METQVANAPAAPKSRYIVIRDFFGFADSKQLKAEVDKLSEADKVELSVGAAQAMGLTQQQVAFSLA